MRWWAGERVGFSPQEKGTSSVEYAIIAGAIALVIIVAVGLLGGTVRDILQQVTDLFPK